MNACTIVARNYLPAARLLAQSFLRYHADSSFTVLLLDGLENEYCEEEFEVLSPYEIGIDRDEVHRMAMIYDVKEFATAVKPWLLQTLLDRGRPAVYFDPDIEIFAALDDVGELARQRSIVLTPHITVPLPQDGLLPDDLMILQAGTYNLGFIAVGPSAGPFLDWWSSKLRRDCRVAIDRGQFVDQRWVDFVPVLFDHALLRDAGCNVAYWNLHERTLLSSGDGYTVDGQPLRFFHFSGFDPRTPSLLSTHLAPWNRIRLSDQPDLARLCQSYGRRLLEHGYEEHAAMPYRFDSLGAGIAISARIRTIYRQALEASEQRAGPSPPDPFDPNAPRVFVDWLNEPVGPGGLSRYLTSLYEDRIDLQGVFPFVGSVHRGPFLRWVATTGRGEEDIPSNLVPPAPVPLVARTLASATRLRLRAEHRLFRAAAKYPVLAKGKPMYRAMLRIFLWAHSRPSAVTGHGELGLAVAAIPAPGVNVAGYLRAELGIGEVARKLVRAIEETGVPFATITYGNTVSRQEHRFDERDARSAPYDTNLVCVNADQLPVFARDAGDEFFSNRYTIGVWFWELGTFPDRFRRSFDFVDEVWVASDFVQAAVGSATSKPVEVVPVPLDAAPAQPLGRQELGLPGSFMFLFTFDFMSIVERKNPLGLITAFKEAFAAGEGPSLVLKSINGERNFAELERLRLAASGRPDIRIIDGYLAPEAKDGLMAACDCYVSLHRSEGLGLTMAEAMSNAKPVIATGYSGNMMFMNHENSYLVDYTLTAVPAGCDPYPQGAQWADPDVAHAAQLLRHVYEHQAEGRERGERAREDIASRHSLAQTAAFISRRLAEIRAPRYESDDEGMRRRAASSTRT